MLLRTALVALAVLLYAFGIGVRYCTDWNAAQDIFQWMMVATVVVGVIGGRYLRRKQESGNAQPD